MLDTSTTSKTRTPVAWKLNEPMPRTTAATPIAVSAVTRSRRRQRIQTPTAMYARFDQALDGSTIQAQSRRSQNAIVAGVYADQGHMRAHHSRGGRGS